MGNAVLLEFVADGVDYPIGQQTEEEVCVRVRVALVGYGAQFKVRLQLAVARLNFTNKIVVFPGRTLVKRTDVGAQEVRHSRNLVGNNLVRGRTICCFAAWKRITCRCWQALYCRQIY